MNTAQWIITAGAVVGALSIIFHSLVKPVLKWGKRIEQAVTVVEQNMVNNGGSSLRDAIDRIEARLDKVEKNLAPAKVTRKLSTKK